jgi:hypothetical protein
MRCKLCETNEANKKGSHIIPDFILRSMLVNDNTSKRSDKIVSYNIDVFGTDIFFGREINKENITKLLNRDLTDKEISLNINHYTVDNVFCTKCENRFSFIESLFNSEFYNLLKQTSCEDKILDLKDKGVSTFKLFWLSVIWRCSIVSFQNFSIELRYSNKLKSLLNNCLGQTLNDTKKLIIENYSLINNEVLGVLFANKIDNYLDNLVFCNPFLKMPYTLVINDFYLFYYAKPTHLKSTNQTMYSLENLFKPNDYINNIQCESIKIGLIPQLNFKESRKCIYGIKASAFLKNATKRFSDVYYLVFKNKPTKKAIGVFVNDLLFSDNINDFERYSDERVITKTIENIIKYVG